MLSPHMLHYRQRELNDMHVVPCVRSSTTNMFRLSIHVLDASFDIEFLKESGKASAFSYVSVLFRVAFSAWGCRDY